MYSPSHISPLLFGHLNCALCFVTEVNILTKMKAFSSGLRQVTKSSNFRLEHYGSRACGLGIMLLGTMVSSRLVHSRFPRHCLDYLSRKPCTFFCARVLYWLTLDIHSWR